MTAITIAKETDKAGKQLEIKHVEKLAHSPVYTFFLRQYAELIDRGFCHPVTTWDDYECGAVYAELDGRIVGSIVYDTKKVDGALWITLSSVDSSYRGNGVYTLLHKHFEEIAKKKGCWFIASNIHIKNETRLATAEKVGMKPIFYFMAKKLQ
jgi:GNAT superfamily N-acetyltransferase